MILKIQLNLDCAAWEQAIRKSAEFLAVPGATRVGGEHGDLPSVSLLTSGNIISAAGGADELVIAALQGIAGVQASGVGGAGGLGAQAVVEVDLQVEELFQR